MYHLDVESVLDDRVTKGLMFSPYSTTLAGAAGAAARVYAASGCSTGPATPTLSTVETVSLSVMHDREGRLADSTSAVHLYA